MKILTWNCNMVFRKKIHNILPFGADILVIQECESLDKLNFKAQLIGITDHIWHGENPHKGLGVFSFNGYKLNILDCHNPDIKNILPISIKRNRREYFMLAIWANNPSDKDGPYITQVWKALQCYDNLISDKKTILIGDFNSNTIWDKPRRIGNHSHVVEQLALKNIHSVYHKQFNQEQGKEEQPTFYLYRHLDKPYHLDYCFVSKDIIRHLSSVTIGRHEDWIAFSDHVPVVVEISK